MSLYQEIILDHYQHPRNQVKLNKPTSAVSVNNPLCGDEIRMEVELKNDQINNIAFFGHGCAISIASASMLTEFVKGKKKKELIKLDRNFMIKLLGVEVGPNRLKCVLLSLEALKKILNYKLLI